MTYKEIIKKVASDLSLPEGFVDRTYRAYWKAVKQYITTRDLKKDMTEEEFSARRPNVNIPSIGKFYVPYSKQQALMRKYNYYNTIKDAKD